jgi:4-alpha-glucanotransferase
VGVRHHHGVSLPLFTLHTNRSGIGDFGDLFPFIDWCKQVGFSSIQLLPLNDTGDDPSPYNVLSANSLDPVYLHVPELTSTAGWSRAQIKAAKIEKLKGKDLQQLACQQMRAVKRYADLRGVLLIGDIPILVNPQSVDVSKNPSLFDLRYSAGAAPDLYSQSGQEWGFPIYCWEEMRKENFAWWRERLAFAEQFFHLYRIDHVVGFFRIWAIPQGAHAVDGRYLPADPQLWEAQGREILEMMIDATHMLPLAEDLGTIPEVVPRVLRELGICGTKVMRWQKISPQNYEPISMTTVSTADSEPLNLWWRNAPEEAREFAGQKGWNYEATLLPWQHREILREAHHSASLFHINLLQEYLALFPELVSPDLKKERINVPGTVGPENWSYRCIPTLEEIIKHRGLAEEIQRVIQ